ncbi:MAG: hypothetical protein V4819_25245 [Verrucomicrobiota bacterium]
MKFLSVLLAVAMTAHAAPSDPGKVAIDFLEKVRQRKLDLEPGGDTALSAQTADEKKRQIAHRLDRMASDLGSDPLEIGEVRMDENFAAVLIRKVGGFDPSRLQVFPVALVKRGAEWTAAPVPASFENAGTGYAIALRKRLELLENWMLREQVVDLEKLREQSAGRMRRKIEVSLPAKELRSFSSKEVGERFVAACERKDQSTVLGLLGGLSAKLPEDWAARLKAVDQTFAAGSTAPRPWRLLTSPDVIRVLVHHEEVDDSGLISIGCLDPAGTGNGFSSPRLETIECDLTKGPDGLWQINLPASFLQESDEPTDEPDESLDSEHLDAFPEKWTQAHPPVSQPEAELARQALVRALGDGDLKSLLAISQLGGSPEQARKACLEAAQLWWTVHDPTAVRHAMPLAFKADGTAAVGIFQFFSTRDPDLLDVRTVYFEKSAAGWLWTPEPTALTREKFQVWVDSESRRWPDQWQQTLLGDSPLLAKIDGLAAPTKEDARKTVEAWLDATRHGDVTTALPLIARLNDPKSGSTALQNLGYEIIGYRRSKEVPVITGIYQGATWTTVGVKVDQDGKPSYPLFPVIQTDRGPRIVIEIDLFASGNRGREYLNRMALDRLQKSSSAATAAELRGLFTEHQASVEGQSGKASR